MARFTTIVFVLALLVLAGAGMPALAADEGGEGGHGGHGGGHGDSNIFVGGIELAIWTIVVFLLLMGILGKFAWPLMLQGLEKRERAIAVAMEEARAAQARAAQIQAELDARMKAAGEEIRKMMEDSRRHADQLAETIKAEGRAANVADRERLTREIETRADQALQEMMSRVGQLASLVASKVIRRQVTEDDHRRLVDEALAELQQAARERQRVLAELS